MELVCILFFIIRIISCLYFLLKGLWFNFFFDNFRECFKFVIGYKNNNKVYCWDEMYIELINYEIFIF